MKNKISVFLLPLLCVLVCLSLLPGCSSAREGGGTSAPPATAVSAPLPTAPPASPTEAPGTAAPGHTEFPAGRFARVEDVTAPDGSAEKRLTVLLSDGAGGAELRFLSLAPVSYAAPYFFAGQYYLDYAEEDFPGSFRAENGQLVFSPDEPGKAEVAFPCSGMGEMLSLDGFVRDDAHDVTAEIPAEPASGDFRGTTAGSCCARCGAVVSAPEPVHSALYAVSPGLSADEVTDYFTETVLSFEVASAASSVYVSKWPSIITYEILGPARAEDRALLAECAARLCAIPGFPGMREAVPGESAALEIYFCSDEEFAARAGALIGGGIADGAAAFRYDPVGGEIRSGTVCYRTEMDERVRRSVLLEEIYNVLGFKCDTVRRRASIIYQCASDAQDLSPTDELLLRILYDPTMKNGMDAAHAAEVIRSLYY